MEDSTASNGTDASRPLLSRAVGLVERLTPRRTSEPESFYAEDEHRRLIAAVFVMLLTIALVVPMGIANVLQGRTDNAAIALCVAVGAGLLLVFIRRGVRTATIAHLTAALLVLPAAIGAFTSPLPMTTSILAFLAAPLVVTFLAGGRHSWWWCGIGVVIYGTLSFDATSNVQQWMLALSIATVGLTAIAHGLELMRIRIESDLVHARDEANAAAEAKTRFLANMSHEIRTPMNGVLGMLGLLLKTKLDDVQHDYASTAHGSGVALLDLLNDILDFSKIEAGQMELELAPVNLCALIEEVLDQLAVLAEDKGLTLALRYAPNTPTRVKGDAARIRQILLNLVGNALKFTHEGHVLVTVEHEERTDEPSLFTLVVEDTGIGIAEADQSAIFEHFQQGDMSTTKTFGGTGLGLAIVRELAGLMHGEISVRSELGKGSAFSLTLPLPIDSLIATATQPIVLRSLAGCRFLLVNDRVLERSVVRERLEHWGFEVTESESSDAALEQIEHAARDGEPFTFALVSHPLPQMSGLDLTRRIKSTPSAEETIVMVLSAVTHPLDSQALRDAGAEASLAKPFRYTALLEVITDAWTARHEQAVLGGSAPVRTAAPPEPEPEPKPLSEHELHLLVVEDNVVNQKVAQHMLIDMGCQVDVAANGRKALEMVGARRYDLVFMDVQMPEMDGLQATAELRRRQSKDEPPLPIVAMTAHALPSDRQLCLDAGMDGYVTKPVRREDLLEAIEEYALAEPLPEIASSPEPAVDIAMPCDLRWLRHNYNADDEVLHSLVHMFLNRATELLELMRQALDVDDRVALGRHAHALKGISGTVRANPLFSLLSDSPDALATSMDRIEHTFDTLQEYLVTQLGLR